METEVDGRGSVIEITTSSMGNVSINALDGEEIEFSGGFTDLHTLVYQKTLAGEGFGIDEAKTAIQIVHDIRNIEPTGINHNSHPIFQQHRS